MQESNDLSAITQWARENQYPYVYSNPYFGLGPTIYGIHLGIGNDFYLDIQTEVESNESIFANTSLFFKNKRCIILGYMSGSQTWSSSSDLFNHINEIVSKLTGYEFINYKTIRLQDGSVLNM